MPAPNENDDNGAFGVCFSPKSPKRRASSNNPTRVMTRINIPNRDAPASFRMNRPQNEYEEVGSWAASGRLVSLDTPGGGGGFRKLEEIASKIDKSTDLVLRILDVTLCSQDLSLNWGAPLFHNSFEQSPSSQAILDGLSSKVDQVLRKSASTPMYSPEIAAPLTPVARAGAPSMPQAAGIASSPEMITSDDFAVDNVELPAYIENGHGGAAKTGGFESPDALAVGFGTKSADADAYLQSAISKKHSTADAYAKKEAEMLDKLRQSLKLAEQIAREEARAGTLSERLMTSADTVYRKHKRTCFDIIMLSVIVMNSLTIGLSMDVEYSFWHPWAVLDLAYTTLYVAELLIKIYLLGIKAFFNDFSNCFDFFIVGVDIGQLLLTPTGALDNAPSVSVFRLLRIARLSRLTRFLRFDLLEPLVAMITGMLGGLPTLWFALLVFIVILYVSALIFREFLGRTDDAIVMGSNLSHMFNSVPRSMLTMFRYFFSGFSSFEGVNMFEGIPRAYGVSYGIFVCVFYFLITVGVFNVVASIFVQSTMAAASAMDRQRKLDRMNDEFLWATRIATLIRKMFEYNETKVNRFYLSDQIDELVGIDIPKSVFIEFMLDKEVIEALNDFEIDPTDHKYLFDILDNDNTGKTSVFELVNGLQALRGDPRRSDIVCVDLMMRSVQRDVDLIQDEICHLVSGMSALLQMHGTRRLSMFT